MRISELSHVTGVPTPTVKFYLREGLLHPGEATSRTQSRYDATHVDRLRLIRALVEVAGLPLASVAQVLAAIDSPEVARLGLLATAQAALQTSAPASREIDDAPAAASQAAAWLAQRGWQVEAGDPQIDQLDRAWQACLAAGIDLTPDRMDSYADAIEQIAGTDLAAVPEEPEAAVRYVILGTILLEPVLNIMRRLAHQHVSTRVETEQSQSRP